MAPTAGAMQEALHPETSHRSSRGPRSLAPTVRMTKSADAVDLAGPVWASWCASVVVVRPATPRLVPTVARPSRAVSSSANLSTKGVQPQAVPAVTESPSPTTDLELRCDVVAELDGAGCAAGPCVGWTGPGAPLTDPRVEATPTATARARAPAATADPAATLRTPPRRRRLGSPTRSGLGAASGGGAWRGTWPTLRSVAGRSVGGRSFDRSPSPPVLLVSARGAAAVTLVPP